MSSVWSDYESFTTQYLRDRSQGNGGDDNLSRSSREDNWEDNIPYGYEDLAATEDLKHEEVRSKRKATAWHQQDWSFVATRHAQKRVKATTNTTNLRSQKANSAQQGRGATKNIDSSQALPKAPAQRKVLRRIEQERTSHHGLVHGLVYHSYGKMEYTKGLRALWDQLGQKINVSYHQDLEEEYKRKCRDDHAVGGQFYLILAKDRQQQQAFYQKLIKASVKFQCKLRQDVNFWSILLLVEEPWHASVLKLSSPSAEALGNVYGTTARRHVIQKSHNPSDTPEIKQEPSSALMSGALRDRTNIGDAPTSAPSTQTQTTTTSNHATSTLSWLARAATAASASSNPLPAKPTISLQNNHKAFSPFLPRHTQVSSVNHGDSASELPKPSRSVTMDATAYELRVARARKWLDLATTIGVAREQLQGKDLQPFDKILNMSRQAKGKDNVRKLVGEWVEESTDS